VTVGDFNADGQQDLATADFNANTVTVLPGLGTGSFLAGNLYGVGKRPNALTVGDFNADGQQDLATTNTDSSTVSILLNIWPDGGAGQFINLGNGLAGNSAPVLTGSGSLAAAGNFLLKMTGLPTFTTTYLVVGHATLLAPFKGGIMGPTVDLVIPVGTAMGTVVQPATTPPGIPSATSIYMQSWTPDAGGPAGVDATNVMQCLFP